MNKKANAFSLCDVHFSYDGDEALSGVTLDVAAGEYVCLIGPNGAGKTTLLRLMSGAVKPSSGEVRILDTPVRRLARLEIARRVAVVTQESGATFPFTVEEVVLMGRFPHLGPYGFEGPRDFEAADEAMRMTETLEFRDRHIHDLSGGERQRVIIARALAQEAEILLLDEPTSFLDIKHQVEITRLVKRLKEDKDLTIVATSHDLNLAAAFSDRLVLLKEGRVFMDGPPRDVISESVLSQAYETAVHVEEWDQGRFVTPRFHD